MTMFTRMHRLIILPGESGLRCTPNLSVFPRKIGWRQLKNESMDALFVFAYLPNWTWLETLNKCIKHIVYDIKPKWVFGGVRFLCGLCTKWQTTEISKPKAASRKVIRQTRAHLRCTVSLFPLMTPSVVGASNITLHIWNWFLIKNLFKRMQLASQRCHNGIHFAKNPIERTN